MIKVHCARSVAHTNGIYIQRTPIPLLASIWEKAERAKKGIVVQLLHWVHLMEQPCNLTDLVLLENREMLSLTCIQGLFSPRR